MNDAEILIENKLTDQFIDELKAEVKATRRCLENIPENLYDWKPHEKSMKMGDLATLVASIPGWIQSMIEGNEINLASYPYATSMTTKETVSLFDKNMGGVIGALENTSDEDLEEMFYLKNKDQVLMSSSKKESVSSTINHMAHHRGQLTVYMRLNNIMVPSIYGPSADDKTW